MILALRIVAALLFPLPVCLLLLGVGLGCLWWTRREQLGKILATVGFGILGLLSLGPVADALLGPLEAGSSPPPRAETRWIIVLGGGYRPDPSLPISARPSGASLVRLVEGVRLHRRTPGSKLIITVGAAAGKNDTRARDVAKLAQILGVADDDLVIIEGPRTTAEEAAEVAGHVDGGPCLLVTSATHMPRALSIFQAFGVEAAPAPTGQRVAQAEYPLLAALPSADNLGKSESAIYEYLAWGWRFIAQP